jgi:dCMP deaminase
MKWGEWFKEQALVIAQKSKDPSTKVGAVIVRPDKTVCSVGYNGFPAGINEDYMDYVKRDLKYGCIIHAEMNALIFSTDPSMKGYKLYCTHAPCNDCLKHIIQHKISEVIYFDGGPMVERGTTTQKACLQRLLLGSREFFHCRNYNDTPYLAELGMSDA